MVMDLQWRVAVIQRWEGVQMPEVQDPFHGLEDWARTVERQATRAHARSRVGRALGRPFRWFARPRLGRRLGFRAGVLVVALLVTGGVCWANRGTLGFGALGFGALGFGAPGGADPRSPSYPRQSHPAGVYATSTASARPTDPFGGTPAATYPVGEAGITMPPAVAIGQFSVDQVAVSLDQVRRALIAGRLDRRMLVDRDPSGFLALLAPASADNVRGWFAKGEFETLGSQLAPGARLLPQLPRVSGRTTMRAAAQSDGLRYLEIVTNYVWVYPVDGPDLGVGSRLVIVHDEVHWGFYRPIDVTKRDVELQVIDTQAYEYNVNCAQGAKGLLALPGGEGDLAPYRSPEDPDQYYDPNRSLDIPNDCQSLAPRPSRTP